MSYSQKSGAAMRVYDRSLTETTAAESSRTSETYETARGPSASASGPKGYGDCVELSGTLARLSRALSVYGSNRAAQVQALAVQYQSGRYHSDPMRTSRSIISETFAATAQ